MTTKPSVLGYLFYDYPRFPFFAADWDGDAIPELMGVLCNETGTKRTEVHIWSGASGYTDQVWSAGTPLGETNLPGDPWSFDFADYDGNGKPDLFAIRRVGTNGKTELHILDGASGFQRFHVQLETGFGKTPESLWAFSMCDWDQDGKPDLAVIKRRENGTRSTEVFILSSSSGYQQRIQETGTGYQECPDSTGFLMLDWDMDGIPDLCAIHRSATGTGEVELHIFSGRSVFKDAIFRGGIGLPAADRLPQAGTILSDGSSESSSILMASSSGGTLKTEVRSQGGSAQPQGREISNEPQRGSSSDVKSASEKVAECQQATAQAFERSVTAAGLGFLCAAPPITGPVAGIICAQARREMIAAIAAFIQKTVICKSR
jgi:hypothetical protein